MLSRIDYLAYLFFYQIFSDFNQSFAIFWYFFIDNFSLIKGIKELFYPSVVIKTFKV